MGILKVRTRRGWEIAAQAGVPGPQGPPGPPGPPSTLNTDGLKGLPGGPVPVGGRVGQLVRKLDTPDFVTAWSNAAPRGLVFDYQKVGPDSVTAIPVNTWTPLVDEVATIDVARMYQVWMGWRGISDAGTDCNATMNGDVNGITLFDDRKTTAGAAVGLWGSWCQMMVRTSGQLGVTGFDPMPVPVYLEIYLSVANLAVYAPRITILDIGPSTDIRDFPPLATFLCTCGQDVTYHMAGAGPPEWVCIYVTALSCGCTGWDPV